MDIPEPLEKKAGPLPVWVWGIGLGVIVVGVMWYRRSASGDAPVATMDSVDAGSTGFDDGTIDNAGLYSGNNSNAANATNATNSMARQVRTNPAWLRQAVQYETGKGRNALTVMRAMMRYLNGQPLTEKQAGIVSDVLKNVGIPPKPPTKVSPTKHKRKNETDNGPAHQTPGTKPTTKPRRKRAGSGSGGGTAGHVRSQTADDRDVVPRVGMVSGITHGEVDAVADDSPASIALRVYGASTPHHIDTIRKANGIGTADSFVPGQKVRVPVV